MAAQRAGHPRGLVHLYTGAGKGKTSAAWGLALRAAGHGKRVKVIEFIKGPRLTGEHLAARRLGRLVSVEVCGAGFCRGRDAESLRRHRECAAGALSAARRALACGRWDVVILDEAAGAAGHGLVSAAKLVRVIRSRPPGVEVVVTGRGAPRELQRAADYLTEMRAVRHPYARGLKARKGIEF